MIHKSIIYKFFKYFTNHSKKTKRGSVFAVYYSSAFLNTSTTDETWKKSGKQDFFRHIRTRRLGRIKLVMTFVTNLGVIGILCSFRVVLERKAGKKISDTECKQIYLCPAHY